MKSIKKILVAALVAVFVLVLFGCASGQQSSSAASSGSEGASSEAASSEAASSEASESGEAASSESMVGMPNPWSDAASAEEAGQGAFGDTFSVPESLPVGDVDWIGVTYSYMDGIAQADYEAGAVMATVRKGKDVSGEMLHGVYEKFDADWTVVCGDIDVACQGYELDFANLMEWSADGYNYSVYIVGTGGENFGVGVADVPNVVASIK